MADPKNSISEIAANVQSIYTIKEHLVDKDLTELESRLNGRIDFINTEFKEHLKQLKKDLKWFVGIVVSAGVGVTGIIVTLIVKLLS